jgi:hypothetical protein
MIKWEKETKMRTCGNERKRKASKSINLEENRQEKMLIMYRKVTRNKRHDKTQINKITYTKYN